jgi:hypothetical protein
MTMQRQSPRRFAYGLERWGDGSYESEAAAINLAEILIHAANFLTEGKYSGA